MVLGLLNTTAERTPINPEKPIKWQTRRVSTFFPCQVPIWNAGMATYREGEILYVKEHHQIIYDASREKYSAKYFADNTIKPVCLSYSDKAKLCERKRPYAPMPGRFMYESLARYWIRIESIDLQKVEDCSTEDAIAEGFASYVEFIAYFYELHPTLINQNPWVWVYRFNKIDR